MSIHWQNKTAVTGIRLIIPACFRISLTAYYIRLAGEPIMSTVFEEGSIMSMANYKIDRPEKNRNFFRKSNFNSLILYTVETKGA